MKDIFSKRGFSLERLQTLAEVLQAGSYALAAENNTNRENTISRQMSDLEGALRPVRLFDKTKKPFIPTPAAQRLAYAYERFVREVEEVSAESSGLARPITVGAGEVVIRELLIPWIGKHRKEMAANTWMMRNLMWRKIQHGLESELIDIGIADRLEKSGDVEVVDLVGYGYKLVLPRDEIGDNTGWKRLKDLPVVVLEDAGRFRRFLAECEREHGVILRIGAECTTYPQVVDLAEATGSAVFVPEYWWRNRKEDWKERTHTLPGLEKHQRTMRLGWNQKVAGRRPEVAALVNALAKKVVTA